MGSERLVFSGRSRPFDTTSWGAYTFENMVRTQIQLTEQQARRLRAEARERGVSLAEIIRRYVEKGLSGEGPDRAALYERAAALHEAGLDLLSRAVSGC